MKCGNTKIMYEILKNVKFIFLLVTFLFIYNIAIHSNLLIPYIC